jgi:dTDP-glucose 4,6-dehydratase
MSKRVLITGGQGSIAHHVIDKMLKETDWKITCLDRLDISGNLNRLHDMLQDHDPKVVSSRLRIVFHDLKAELNEMIVKDIGDIDIICTLSCRQSMWIEVLNFQWSLYKIILLVQLIC